MRQLLLQHVAGHRDPALGGLWGEEVVGRLERIYDLLGVQLQLACHGLHRCDVMVLVARDRRACQPIDQGENCWLLVGGVDASRLLLKECIHRGKRRFEPLQEDETARVRIGVAEQPVRDLVHLGQCAVLAIGGHP